MKFYQDELDEFTGLDQTVGMGFLGAAAVKCPVYQHKVKKVCVDKKCPKNKVLDYVTGKCVKAPTVALQCPTAASQETAARNFCAGQGQALMIVNCSPFNYQCGAGTGLVGQCPAGYVMNVNGQCVLSTQQGVCAAGYVQQYAGGPCVLSAQQGGCPSGYAMDSIGRCQPLSVLYPNLNTTCPYGRDASGNCLPYSQYYNQYQQQVQWPSYLQPVGGAQYLPAPTYQYGYGGGYSQYAGPLLTPIEAGAEGAEISPSMTAEEYQATPITPSAYPAQYGGSVPLLTPVSDAGEDFESAGYPSYGSAQSAVAQGSAASCPGGAATKDQWGSLQVVQTVCAATRPSTGGYPSQASVEQEDIAMMAGLGFMGRHLG